MSYYDKTTVHMKHVEGEDLPLVAAPAPWNGAVLTRTEVSAVTIKVYDLTSDTPDTAVLTVTPSLSANPPGLADDECMFDAIQEDDVWDGPGGYTFAYRIKDGAYHFEGGRTYLVEAAFTAGHAANLWPQLDDYGVLYRRWKVRVVGVTGA